MNEPDLVLFDEPTSRPSTPTSASRSWSSSAPSSTKRGTAAIVVTHDDRMTHYCDRVVHIVDGVLTG